MPKSIGRQRGLIAMRRQARAETAGRIVPVFPKYLVTPSVRAASMRAERLQWLEFPPIQPE